MKKDLYLAAKAYTSVIEKIEETSDRKKLHLLEEKRVELHCKFLDLLKRDGIRYRDRDHATKIAFKIVKDYEPN